MNIRNPHYNEFGTIDCEVFYDEIGWIPFTASINDTVGEAPNIYQDIMDGKVGEIGPYVPPTPIEKTFEEQKKEKLIAIDLIAKAKRDVIVQNYSSGEMASWAIKRDEALKWTESQDVDDAPSLLTEAFFRKVDLGFLVTKVLGKAQQLSMIEAAIAGHTGYLQDLVKTIADNDLVALQQIDIEANWPF